MVHLKDLKAMIIYYNRIMSPILMTANWWLIPYFQTHQITCSIPNLFHRTTWSQCNLSLWHAGWAQIGRWVAEVPFQNSRSTIQYGKLPIYTGFTNSKIVIFYQRVFPLHFWSFLVWGLPTNYKTIYKPKCCVLQSTCKFLKMKNNNCFCSYLGAPRLGSA